MAYHGLEEAWFTSLTVRGACRAYHGCAAFDEPVKSELRGLSDSGSQLIVHILLIKAELMQHTDEEPAERRGIGGIIISTMV